MQHTQHTLFIHDSTSIFYPVAPGRVYIISISALADCDGSDEDYTDSTSIGDLMNICAISRGRDTLYDVWKDAPRAWPTSITVDGAEVEMDNEERDADFLDALESWADHCDRDSARMDSLDEIRLAIERAS